MRDAPCREPLQQLSGALGLVLPLTLDAANPWERGRLMRFFARPQPSGGLRPGLDAGVPAPSTSSTIAMIFIVLFILFLSSSVIRSISSQSNITAWSGDGVVEAVISTPHCNHLRM